VTNTEKTKIKVVVQAKKKDVPGWPHINYDYEKETQSVLNVLSQNTDMEFDVFKYTHVSQAETAYPDDLKKYDGVLVCSYTGNQSCRTCPYILTQYDRNGTSECYNSGSGQSL
jgi:hypothetical protein